MVWRNNVGVAWQGEAATLDNGNVFIERARRIRYGLMNGSSDLIGIRVVTITQDMVGKKIGQFMGVEVKTEKGLEKEAQQKFRYNVLKKKGFCVVSRSVEDICEKLEGEIK